MDAKVDVAKSIIVSSQDGSHVAATTTGCVDERASAAAVGDAPGGVVAGASTMHDVTAAIEPPEPGAEHQLARGSVDTTLRARPVSVSSEHRTCTVNTPTSAQLPAASTPTTRSGLEATEVAPTLR